MSEDTFDQDAWLARIGYDCSRAPTLQALQALMTAHSGPSHVKASTCCWIGLRVEEAAPDRV